MLAGGLELRGSRTSLSARRAWIEINPFDFISRKPLVALRKESVDRNKNNPVPALPVYASLSARRAWIEIAHLRQKDNGGPGRSPQGERG